MHTPSSASTSAQVAGTTDKMEELVSRELALRMARGVEGDGRGGLDILRLVASRLSSVKRSVNPEPADETSIQIPFGTIESQNKSASTDQRNWELNSEVSFRTQSKPASMDQRDWELYSEVNNLLQQHIYSASYRIHELDPLLAKYNGSVAFRTAFIMCALEDLLEEMRQRCSRLPTLARLSVMRHINEYWLILKRHIDITYVVERAILMLNQYATLTDRYNQDYKDNNITVEV